MLGFSVRLRIAIGIWTLGPGLEWLRTGLVDWLSTARSQYNLVHYKWTNDCDLAFNESKNKLLEANILTFYDPRKPLIVVTDASSYGLGGVLAQIENGIEKPVCFTSFSLNPAQKNYPILHLGFNSRMLNQKVP